MHLSGNVTIDSQSSHNVCRFIAIYRHSVNHSFNFINGSGRQISRAVSCVFTFMLLEKWHIKIFLESLGLDNSNDIEEGAGFFVFFFP